MFCRKSHKIVLIKGLLEKEAASKQPLNKDIEEFFPAYPVKAIDTTAAGDCFTAAFALALSQNKNWKEAIEFGQKASSIAVTRKGAQTSIPTREEVDEMKGGKM